MEKFNNSSELIKFIESRRRISNKVDLSKMNQLLDIYNHPEKNLNVIHITGTNGKGSTVSFLNSIFRQANLNVGCFTSPYITCFNERIRFNDENISDEDLLTIGNEIVSKYDTLPEFLEQAALMTTDDDEADRIDDGKNVVSIMTIHAAKGLEFDNVFLPAWEENIFPNEKSIKEDGIEEERRLAYVAITRARRRAVISNAMTRVMFGSRQYNSPSRFITEMDNRFVDFQGGTPRGYSQAYHTPKQPQKHTDIQTMVGKLVSHDELGRGTVIAENGEVLTVAFGNRGIKNVMKSYVTVL